MNSQKMTVRHILVFINCCLIMATGVGLWFQCTGIFYNPVTEALGVGKGTLTLYVTIGYAATMLYLPYASKVLDKIGARAVAVMSEVALALVFFLFSRATSVATFYIGGAISALSTANALYLLMPTMVNRWFAKRVGFFVGLASSFSGIFGMIFNPVGQSVISSFGWRGGYLFYMILTLVLGLPLSIFCFHSRPEDMGLKPYGYGDAPAAQVKDVPAEAEGIEYRQARKTPAFWMLVIMTLLTPMICMVNPYIPSYATTVGMTAATGALLATFTQIGNLASKFGLGAFSDRKPKLALILAFGLCFAGLILLLTMGSSGGVIILISGALYGCCNCTTPVLNPLVARKVFGTKDMSNIWSHISPEAAIAAAIGGSAWGFIYDATDSYTLCLIIVAIMCVVAAGLGLAALNSKRALPSGEETAAK